MIEEPYDIAIVGATVLTLSTGMDVLEDAVIGIRGERISLVEAHRDVRAAKRIDAHGCLVMPGLVNTHTHLPMVAFRGMADDLTLMDWLHHHIFPAEARFVNKEMVYSSTILAMAEMIRSGTTTCCDGYFFENEIARAVTDCGMRAVLSQGFADFATPDAPKFEKMMAAARRFVTRWMPCAPMITPAFFCHSPYTCSPETLANVKAVAREYDILYLTHLLENADETGIIEKRYGKKPVSHLDALGVLDEQTIAVHCNWLTPEDMEIFAARGVRVSSNPGSSMKLAAGVAPVPDMLRLGIPVGLGTDGAASSNTLDMFREMDLAAKVHKVMRCDPTVMSAKAVVQMATLGGARVLGLDSLIGSVEVGKLADLIIIDMNQPHLTPLYNPYSQLVYAARGADVLTSIINGRIVMENRTLQTLGLPETMQNVRNIAQKIQKEGACTQAGQ